MSDINFGAITEALNDKADRDLNNTNPVADYVVENYNDGTNWYRVYKSGWVEQGGTGTVQTNISLLKEFANTNYSIVWSFTSGSRENTKSHSQLTSKTTTSFIVDLYDANNTFLWRAEGQGAE